MEAAAACANDTALILQGGMCCISLPACPPEISVLFHSNCCKPTQLPGSVSNCFLILALIVNQEMEMMVKCHANVLKYWAGVTQDFLDVGL